MGLGAGQTSQVWFEVTHCPLLLSSILTSVTRQTWPPPCFSVQSWLLQISLLTKNFRCLRYIHTKQIGIEITVFLLTISNFWRPNTKHSLLDFLMLTAFCQFHKWINERVSLGSTASQALAFESSAISCLSRDSWAKLFLACKSLNLSSKSQLYQVRLQDLILN